MANAKISDDTVFVPETSDVRNITGLAGINSSGNTKITGSFLARSVVNEFGSGVGTNDGSNNINSRVAFYGVGNPSDTLAGSEGFQYYSANISNSTPASLRLGVPGGTEYDAGNLILSGNYQGSGQGNTSPKIELRSNDVGTPNAYKYFILTTTPQATNDQLWQLPKKLPTNVGEVLSVASINNNDVLLEWGKNPTYALGTSQSSNEGKIQLTDSVSGSTPDTVTIKGAGTVSITSNAAGEVTITGASSSASSFTTKTGADVIDWDYATDGPNLRVNLASGKDNVLTIDTLTEFPNGSTGFVIMDPTNSTSYKMPDEAYGSAAGMTSLMSGGDSTLGGTNEVLWEWTYDGSTFYWQKFQNYVDPIYPPTLDFDSTNLMAFYDPATYPNSVNGANVTSGTAVEDLTNGTLIGDLAIGTTTTNFEHYTADASVQRPAFWSMGNDENSIQTPGSGFTALTTNHTVQCYIQGPYSGSYSTIFDFDTSGDGGYDELLYVNDDNKFEFDYSSGGVFSYPALIDYSGNTGGADLSEEWIFISMSTSSSANQVILHVGCQSSLDAAVAAGGATNWNYDGLGNTVAVDANGLYKQTLTNQTIPNTNFDRFFYGQSVSTAFGESALCHLGILGIYSTILNDTQVANNWIDSRGIYYIT